MQAQARAGKGRSAGADLWSRSLMGGAVRDAFKKLHPRWMLHNPVMFVVEVCSALTTADAIRDLIAGHGVQFNFSAQIAIWLWLTVLFANFAEAMAEGRGQAQAAALRRARTEVDAKKVSSAGIEVVPGTSLVKDDVVLVEAGDVIPGDGEVIQGVAAVDESAITGESAPVVREAGGDRSAVTGGTMVISDQLRVRITAGRGESFLDRMIALVEGAARQKTPNEIALAILLAGLTLIFVIVVVTLAPFSVYSHAAVSVTVLVALLVCLVPTTIGGLLSAIGISGMNRLLQHNVVALSGRAIEAAGDVNVIMLDKTGTLTLGNRQAVEFQAVPGVAVEVLAETALLSSLSDETPEGRSIVALARGRYGASAAVATDEAEFVPFTAQTRMSGVNRGGVMIRKGAGDAVAAFVAAQGGVVPPELDGMTAAIGRAGGTPLVVAAGARCLGVIYLKDVVKTGIRERLQSLRLAGIKTVMITGDNPLTAETIAREVGVDDFLAQATPERKMEYVLAQKREGYLVAMVGDGTNDAPALAHADVAVAMNTGTMAAREAGNMIDLDSNPQKLIDIVETGKQILITRGSLTTFSVANDVAKYFAILPAMFVVAYPGLEALNVMHLTSPETAILSAVIFNALIIPLLIPLALRGVTYRPVGAATLLRNNLLVYGLGGLALPFVGIKLIDLAVTALHLVQTNVR